MYISPSSSHFFLLITRFHFQHKLHIEDFALHNTFYCWMEFTITKSLSRIYVIERVLFSLDLLPLCYRGQGHLSQSLPVSVEAWTIVSYSHHQMALCCEKRTSKSLIRWPTGVIPDPINGSGRQLMVISITLM